MALPNGVSSFTLLFDAEYDALGNVAFAGLKGTLTPTAPIVHIATGVLLVEPITFTIGSDGTASVGPLVANDDPAIVQGTGYTVTWQIASYKRKPAPGNLTFAVLRAQGSVVKFSGLGTYTPGGSYVLPLVTSWNGHTGAVVATAADVGADAAGAAASAQAFARQRANHTGTQTASTISDLGPAVAADPAARAAFGRIVRGPSLPTMPAGEYVWFKTDGNGVVLDILSGVAS